MFQIPKFSSPPSLLEAEATGEEFWLYCESLRQLTRIFAYAQLSTDAVTVECLGQMELMIGKVNLRNWGKSIFLSGVGEIVMESRKTKTTF